MNQVSWNPISEPRCIDNTSVVWRVCLSQQVGRTQTRRRSMLYEILNKYTNLLFWLWALSFPSNLCFMCQRIAVRCSCVKLCTNLSTTYIHTHTHTYMCVFIHRQNYCENAKVYFDEEKRAFGKINQILTNIFTARTQAHTHISN